MIVRVILVAWLIGAGAMFNIVLPLRAQDTQDTINERNRSAISVMASEIDILRKQDLNGRLRVVEDAIFEVKWLGRTVSAVLLGQLVLGIFERRKRVR